MTDQELHQAERNEKISWLKGLTIGILCGGSVALMAQVGYYVMVT